MSTTAAPAPVTAPVVAPATAPVVPAVPAAPVYVPSGDEAAKTLLGAPPAKTREEIRQGLVQGGRGEVVTLDATPAVAEPLDIAAAPDGAEAPTEVPAPTAEGEAIATAPGDGLTFKVKGADGKYRTPAEVSEQKTEFKIGDKMYVKSQSELVRMAAGSVNAARVANENRTLKQNVQQTQQQYEQRLTTQRTELQTALDAQMALAIELLEAPPEVVNQRREAWAAQNTPEKEAARLRAELVSTRETFAQQEERNRHEANAGQFRARLEPIFADFNTKYPEVSPETRWGKIMSDTIPIMVNGQIPSQAWPAYEAYLRGPFTQWVAQESGRLKALSETAQAALQKAEDDALKARQRAVQAEARGMMPTGAASPDRPAQRTPSTREEVRQSIVQGQGRT